MVVVCRDDGEVRRSVGQIYAELKIQSLVIVLAIITQEVWHTEMPVWGILVAFALAALYVIP
jgi:hypothetical protein